MKKAKPLYHGPPIPGRGQAVRWYYRFQLSLRNMEQLLFERGAVVSCESIRRWCDKFGADFAPPPGQSCSAQSRQHMVSGRDVRNPSRRALPCCCGWSTSMVPNSMSCCRSGVTRPRPNASRAAHQELSRPSSHDAFLSSFGPVRQHSLRSGICCADRSFVNTSPPAFPLGLNPPALPKICPPCSERWIPAILSHPDCTTLTWPA